MTLKRIAMISGIVFIAVALLGFVPALSPAESCSASLMVALYLGFMMKPATITT